MRPVRRIGLVLVALLALGQGALAGEVALRLEERISAELQRSAGRQPPELLALQQFYAERGFAPVWVGEMDAGPRAETAAKLLAGAEADGLDSADYAAAAIAARLGGRSAPELADLEFRLSRGLVEFGRDLHGGRVQPAKVDPELHLTPRPVEPLALLTGAAAAPDLPAYMAGLAPATPEYARIKRALADYRAVAARGGWTKVPAGDKLKPGARNDRVRMLRARLAETGDLKDGGGEPDLYDAAVEQAVRHFQYRHGLAQDGTVGPETLAALNVPVERRIAQMALNMERRRWMPADLGERYVFVNLADFTLKVVEGPKTVHDARVIVGKPYFRTPVFSGMMTYIALNPYWHVPPSIATKEILPKLKKNPGYLASQGMRVFTSWAGDAAEVDPRSIDWTAVGPGSFPYRLRQDAGEKNALGRVKFMFPNQFNVYLHDTPSRELFARTVRSFSHGCIRVQNPIELAELLLRDDPDWPRARIDAALAQGEQTIVNLKRPIPVHLTYLTAWVNKDGSVHFRSDIYDRDKRLEAALRRDREEAAGARI